MSTWIIDTETGKFEDGKFIPTLDASGKNFLLGVIFKENGFSKVFYDKKEMWNYIIEGAKKEAKRNKKLSIYGHNMKYDYFQIADLRDKRIRYLSENPFIASMFFPEEVEMDESQFKNYELYLKKSKLNYNIITRVLDKVLINVEKERIKFLDSLSIFRMSAEKLGKIIGLDKLNMEVSSKKDLEEYCIRDCEIIMYAIKLIKNKLSEERIRVKNLCTVSQIAISYIINKLRKEKGSECLFYTRDGVPTEWIHKTKNPNKVHEAYRGGFVRAWKVGFIEKATSIDINSLYPYSAINIKIPNLKTERIVRKPLEIYKQEDLLKKIGVSRVLLKNENNDLGLIMIRTPTKSYVPLSGKYIIGTWTNLELEKAVKEGYKIINIEWSILWEESGWEGFSDTYKKLYYLRTSTSNKFDYNFYKDIMNRSIGKFGQRKFKREVFIDNIEEIRKYLNDKYKILRGVSDDSYEMIISKEEKEIDMKKYYCPIIPTLITAYARCKMYDEYKKIPLKDLLYTDTDSIIFKGNHLDKFKISDKMGDFKIEKDDETNELLENKECTIWGTKSKSIGNNLAVAGAFKKGLDLKQFKEGKVQVKKMIGLRQGNLEQVGSFTNEERDLSEQMGDFIQEKIEMDRQLIYIDEKVEDISFFKNDVDKIMKNIDDVTHEFKKVKKEETFI